MDERRGVNRQQNKREQFGSNIKDWILLAGFVTGLVIKSGADTSSVQELVPKTPTPQPTSGIRATPEPNIKHHVVYGSTSILKQ